MLTNRIGNTSLVNSSDVIKNSDVSDYVELLKPRVMSLAIFTAIMGMLLAPSLPHPVLAIFSIIAIGAGAGAAGAINMWYDRDIDALMERTKLRPLPSNRVDPSEAITLGIVLSLFSVLLLSFSANYIASGLLLSSILFYIFIYTMWLKRTTAQNIVIGGAAGALPPVIGWFAASSALSFLPIILFLIIFLWTPPHFWALCLYRSGDYKKARIPMLTVVSGEHKTRLYILLYSIALVTVVSFPWLFGYLGLIYVIFSSLLSFVFLYFTWCCFKKHKGSEPRLFKYSILYLFLLFLLMPVDKFLYF